MDINELQKVLQDLVIRLESGYSYASAFAEKINGKGAFINSYEKFARIIPENRGVTLTVFNGHYFKEYSTDYINKRHLSELTEQILADILRSVIV